MSDDIRKEIEEIKNGEIQKKFNQYWNEKYPGLEPPIGFFDLFKAGYLSLEKILEPGNHPTFFFKENNPFLAKVHSDEPIFILRAQDVTAPEIVLTWIAKNLDTVDESRLNEAYKTVLAMRRYSDRRDPT